MNDLELLPPAVNTHDMAVNISAISQFSSSQREISGFPRGLLHGSPISPQLIT